MASTRMLLLALAAALIEGCAAYYKGAQSGSDVRLRPAVPERLGTAHEPPRVHPLAAHSIGCFPARPERCMVDMLRKV